LLLEKSVFFVKRVFIYLDIKNRLIALEYSWERYSSGKKKWWELRGGIRRGRGAQKREKATTRKLYCSALYLELPYTSVRRTSLRGTGEKPASKWGASEIRPGKGPGVKCGRRGKPGFRK